MILCDIGNSFFHFYEKGHMWKVSVKDRPDLPFYDDLFVVSVNEKALEKLKKLYPSLQDISDSADFNSSYVGLGVDRVFACMAVEDGVIVDAGSAITVDVMASGLHLGGFILPGIASMQKAYALSAPVLDRKFNFAIDAEVLPQNTVDAISFGAIGAIVAMIQKVTKGKKIYFTGGDGAYLSKFFDNSAVDETLIFKGMQKVIANLAR